MGSQDDIRAALDEQGANLAAARAAESKALDELAKLARQARELGLTKVEIAERGQITRPTLDALLGR